MRYVRTSRGEDASREGRAAAGSGGDFSGRGPRGYRRPDASIREELCDHLTHDPDIDPSDVEVMIVDGDVLLTGTVETREVKRRIEDVAHEIFGVREVDNRLRVGLTLHAPRLEISADDFDMPWPSGD